MFAEFKKFIMRGNVMDLAVGVIIGAAFGKIVEQGVQLQRRSRLLDFLETFRKGRRISGSDGENDEIEEAAAHAKV